ncbi:MAG: hypothetical protein ACLT16_07035 [[Clostridium] innocuum]
MRSQSQNSEASGGQQQVAIARALSYDPDIILRMNRQGIWMRILRGNNGNLP